jgi:hypothetical protein
LEAEVTLEYTDEKTAEAIASAVSPDNVRVPRGLLIRTVKEDRRVVTRIEYEGKLSTFIATVDDLLFCAATAEKTLQTTKRI